MRFFKILTILSEYLVFHKFNSNRNKNLGLRLRESFEKLGPVFVKLGQLLSTRYDFLNENDCNELQKLLDNSRSVPYEKIKEIFKQDFGQYPEKVFLNFCEIPIASASISQVYKARLKTGEKVAIKIKKPGIRRQIEKDMKIFKRVVWISQLFSRTLRLLSAFNLVKELESWLLQETNFENEKQNIIKMNTYFEKDERNYPNVSFVKVHQKYCSKNVITMNFVEGIPLNKLYKKKIKDYDVFASLKNYIGWSISTWFNKKNCLFQADPHPANLIIQKNGKITCIDLGLIGEVTESDLFIMKKTLLAVYLKNTDESVKWSLKMCRVEEEKYAKKIKKDFQKFLDEMNSTLGYWFIGPVKIFIKHKIPVPVFLSAFGRSSIVYDGTIKFFDSEITTLDLVEEELRKGLQKEMLNNIKDIKYGQIIYNLSEKAKECPEKINQIINTIYDNPERLIDEFKKIITMPKTH